MKDNKKEGIKFVKKEMRRPPTSFTFEQKTNESPVSDSLFWQQ